MYTSLNHCSSILNNVVRQCDDIMITRLFRMLPASSTSIATTFSQVLRRNQKENNKYCYDESLLHNRIDDKTCRDRFPRNALCEIN